MRGRWVRPKVPAGQFLSTAGPLATQWDKFLVASQPGAIVQEQQRPSFRQVLLRVMTVQVISLAVLAWLQLRFGR